MVIPFPTWVLEVKSPQWFGGFPSLMYLNLGYVNLEKITNWVDAVNMLPPLVELHLPGCRLVSLPYSISPHQLSPCFRSLISLTIVLTPSYLLGCQM
jgi:hypothetical protein